MTSFANGSRLYKHARFDHQTRNNRNTMIILTWK